MISLIAEDDFTARNILVAVLEKQGHEIVAPETGAAAWQAQQRAKVSIAIGGHTP